MDGRVFDTIANQFAKNGDGSKRIVLKIDVEGAEWDSLLSAPDEVLEQIDQMAVEFHWMEDENFRWVQDEKYLRVVQRLRQFFEVAHIHFNNASCIGGLAPFPTWAYEVLFVSKRLARRRPLAQGGWPAPARCAEQPVIYPHHAAEFDAHTATALAALLRGRNVVAVGECGLDYFRDLSPRDAQRAHSASSSSSPRTAASRCSCISATRTRTFSRRSSS